MDEGMGATLVFAVGTTAKTVAVEIVGDGLDP